MPGAATIILRDYNNNGLPDIAVASSVQGDLLVLFNLGGEGPLWEGLGNGETVALAGAVASGTGVDYDDDKYDDIIVVQPMAGFASVIPNGGAFALRGGPIFGTPINIPIPGEPVAVAAGDLDLDGIPDLVIVSRDTGQLSVLLGNGTPAFTAPLSLGAGTEPVSVALVDLDGDGDLDIAVVTGDGSSQRIVRIIRNDLFGGQLNFAVQTDLVAGAPPQIVLAGDVTGDGAPDLVTVNDSGAALLLLPRGAASSPSDLTVFTFEACRGDANNDRTVDVKDITAILVNFGQDYRPGTGPGDANGDGLVTFNDITFALAFWGRVCQ